MQHLWVIAQTQKSGSADVLIVVAALIALLMLGGAGVMLYRRKVLDDGASSPQHSSMLDELRAAHDAGELSPEEYERARHAIVDRARGADPHNAHDPHEAARVPLPARHWDRIAEPGVDLAGDPLPRPGDDAADNARGPGE